VDRQEIFSKFNCKSEVVRYYNDREYYIAGIDMLPSSSHWTKMETDTLMDLCELYDLRFAIIADRFAEELKVRYDRSKFRKLNLEHLCKSARDYCTGKPLSEEEKAKIRKRDTKTIEKYIFVNRLNPIAFERTIEEVKQRYYEVAKALLKKRKDFGHPIMTTPAYSIQDDLLRKHNWEKVFSRTKDCIDKETTYLLDHIFIEKQIKDVED
jgi:hypothetical protein